MTNTATTATTTPDSEDQGYIMALDDVDAYLAGCDDDMLVGECCSKGDCLIANATRGKYPDTPGRIEVDYGPSFSFTDDLTETDELPPDEFSIAFISGERVIYVVPASRNDRDALAWLALHFDQEGIAGQALTVAEVVHLVREARALFL